MRHLQLLAAAFAVASLQAATQHGEEDFSYHDATDGWVQLAGVCSADPESVMCWKPTGQPDAKLGELMNAYFLTNSQQHMELRFRHRSLMLVLRSMAGFTTSVTNWNLGSLEADPGGPLYQQGNLGSGGSGETTQFYWYYPPDDVDSADVAVLATIAGTPVKLKLDVGATADLGGGTIRLTKVEKGDVEHNPEYAYPGDSAWQNAPRWDIAYDLTSHGPNPTKWIAVTVLDAKGNAILDVDRRGNPIKPKPGPGYPALGVMPYRPLAYASMDKIFLRVNPYKVGILVVTGTSQRRIEFKHVQLRANG